MTLRFIRALYEKEPSRSAKRQYKQKCFVIVVVCYKFKFRGSSNAFILKFDAVSCKLAMLALAAQFRVREPFVRNQSGTFCLQRLVIIIHSLRGESGYILRPNLSQIVKHIKLQLFYVCS